MSHFVTNFAILVQFLFLEHVGLKIITHLPEVN
jgi:hypothetical protein